MSKQLENIKDQINWHWRNSMHTVRFFGLDARAVLPFLVMLVYARLSTLILTIIVVIVFHTLEKLGLTFPSALRALRLWFIGRNRPGRISVRHKRFVDHG